MAHALTSYRKEHQLTVDAFAARIGASKSMVSKWENGKAVPRPAYMQKIIAETGGAVTANDWYRAAAEVAG